MEESNPPNEQPEPVREQIHDPDKIVQLRRIRSLLERRERCIDALEQTTVAAAESKRDESNARLVYIAHLRSLIMDLYGLLLRSNLPSSATEDESEEDVTISDKLESVEIGTFTIDPPDELPTSSTDSRLIRGESPAESKTETVEGLVWFLDNDCPLTFSWEIEVANSSDPLQETKEVVPPLPICLKACKLAIECMQELGIEAEINQDEGDYGFDYSRLDFTDLEDNE